MWFRKKDDRTVLAKAKKMENELRAEWLKHSVVNPTQDDRDAMLQLYAAAQALAWLTDGMKDPLSMIRGWEKESAT